MERGGRKALFKLLKQIIITLLTKISNLFFSFLFSFLCFLLFSFVLLFKCTLPFLSKFFLSFPLVYMQNSKMDAFKKKIRRGRRKRNLEKRKKPSTTQQQWDGQWDLS